VNGGDEDEGIRLMGFIYTEEIEWWKNKIRVINCWSLKKDSSFVSDPK
jgi:hypothetical protein